MKNILKEYGNRLKPLNKAITDFNDMWNVHYFEYNPKDFVISSYGGGSYFNEWESGQAEKQDGYIPLLSIQTEETHGYTLIELNHENAQKLYDEHINVYEWLQYVMSRENQDGWEGFGFGENKKYCHGIGHETSTGRHAPNNRIHSDPKDYPKGSLVLCFGTGGGEAYDQRLLRVIRTKEEENYGYVWDFISDYCSPRLAY